MGKQQELCVMVECVFTNDTFYHEKLSKELILISAALVQLLSYKLLLVIS